MSKNKTVTCVVGARPNFMKIAPIIRALNDTPLRPFLVHTGQHYDVPLSETFFEQLQIPTPDVNLDVGSATHAVQTAEIMKRFEGVLDQYHSDAVLVVGDVNSTIACALVAAKKSIPVVHVEAGLRSGDRSMPEEINRVLTDAISDLLFVTEPSAIANLRCEGIDEKRVLFVGNVMIDSLNSAKSRVPTASSVLSASAVGNDIGRGSPFAVLTLHRPSNVDDPGKLESLLRSLRKECAGMPIVFPIHPRTSARITEFGLDEILVPPSYLVLPPVGYLEMIGLMTEAKVVITDSGGLQEETTALGVPCITLRDNTERPITVEQGTNTLVGGDSQKLATEIARLLETGGKRGRIPELWDGKAAPRIATALCKFLTTA